MPMLPGSYSFVLLQKYLNARGVVLPFVAVPSERRRGPYRVWVWGRAS